MIRENGYYWVKKGGSWHVCEWDNDHWLFGAYNLGDSAFQLVTADKLVPPNA